MLSQLHTKQQGVDIHEKPICSYCIHFYQHYILDSQRCTTVNCGHCTYPWIKACKPHSPACEHFEECAERDLPDREQVISFLTTEFPEAILKKPLPPEIVGKDAGFEYNKEATNS